MWILLDFYSTSDTQKKFKEWINKNEILTKIN